MSHPQKILSSLNCRAKRRFSQNFLVSSHWAEKLVEEALSPRGVEEVWEIGPGLGALTDVLVQKSAYPIRVFEIDTLLAERLRGLYPQIEVIHEDFLKIELNRYLGKKLSLLSNLPYHISSQVFFKLLDYRDSFVQWVLTFQKEFSDRLLSSVNGKEYGALSVLAQSAFEIQSLGVLSPGCFFPEPGVSSRVLVFKPLPCENLPALHSVVKTAFRQRRKKAVTNLSQIYPKAVIETLFEELGISMTARPQEIDIKGFQTLSTRIAKAAHQC